MEPNMLEVHLRHLKYIIAIGQEYIPSFTVLGHVLIFAFLECFQLFGVVTFHPTGFI